MQVYKQVYKMENGQLVQNKENKIEYVCPNGVKRTKTNPTLKDFAEIGYYPVKIVGDIPNFDLATQELKECITLNDDYWEKSFIVVDKVVSE